MDPYSPFRYEHDIYIYGCHNSFSQYQHQNTNLAGYPSVYRRGCGYRRRVAERLYFAGFFLAPSSRRRAFWKCLRNRIDPGFLGNVWRAKKLRIALNEYFKIVKTSY